MRTKLLLCIERPVVAIIANCHIGIWHATIPGAERSQVTASDKAYRLITTCASVANSISMAMATVALMAGPPSLRQCGTHRCRASVDRFGLCIPFKFSIHEYTVIHERATCCPVQAVSCHRCVALLCAPTREAGMECKDHMTWKDRCYRDFLGSSCLPGASAARRRRRWPCGGGQCGAVLRVASRSGHKQLT